MTRQQDSDAPGLPVEITPELITPGVTVGAGRYRLLERVGGDERVGATFWRARDSVLDRDVALSTLTGPEGRRSIQNALAAGRLEHAGIARILDVLGEPRQAGPGLTGLIVTEWIAGADLAALAADATRTGRTLPTVVIARALSPLASAVDAAHRAGVVLGVDHPQRIRIGNDGLARLAFPVASATDVAADDVRGLGAALYLMITGNWPLPDPPAGLQAAPLGTGGTALPPQALRPNASPTLSTLALRCLAGPSTSGVHSGAAVHQLLEQVTNAEADTMLLTPVPVVGGDEGWTPAVIRPDHDAERRRQRKLAIALTVLGLAILVVFAWAGTQMAGFFTDGPSAGGPTLVVPQTSGAPPTSGPSSAAPPASAPGPVAASGVEVFDVTGDPDNPNRVNRATDGDPGSTWKTYDYNQPFPALKPGVGLLVSFAEPVSLAAVQIDSPSAGSTVEIRTAPAGDAGLAGTAVLGTATLGDGRTEIKLNQAPPGQRILIWITGLANRGGKNVTEFGELTFLRAG